MPNYQHCPVYQTWFRDSRYGGSRAREAVELRESSRRVAAARACAADTGAPLELVGQRESGAWLDALVQRRARLGDSEGVLRGRCPSVRPRKRAGKDGRARRGEAQRTPGPVFRRRFEACLPMTRDAAAVQRVGA